MRFESDRPTRRRRPIEVAPFVAGTLALVASACGSSTPSTSPTSSTAAPRSPAAFLSAGLAAQQAGNLSVAIDDYKKVIATAPGSSTSAYANYDLGVIAQVDQKDPASAASEYRAALAVNPNFVDALYNLAIVLTPAQPLVAEHSYKRVIAIQPKNADAHLNLGFVYLTEGEKTQAHTEFTKAIALDLTLAKRIPAGS
ncbi:MAG TPA: tetratricopeptide repeat protein [Acidimicrobiales bacterium]|jgi:tetratricopeptide (TPR) repeat protein|nr:tetratricopeptide repeat protein [Acidimicrobiales bacterium]